MREKDDRRQKPREAGAVSREKRDLINVTPFWVILMANVRHPEPTGGEVS